MPKTKMAKAPKTKSAATIAHALELMRAYGIQMADGQLISILRLEGYEVHRVQQQQKEQPSQPTGMTIHGYCADCNIGLTGQYCVQCAVCDISLCNEHVWICETCNQPHCAAHVYRDRSSGLYHCAEHRAK